MNSITHVPTRIMHDNGKKSIGTRPGGDSTFNDSDSDSDSSTPFSIPTPTPVILVTIPTPIPTPTLFLWTIPTPIPIQFRLQHSLYSDYDLQNYISSDLNTSPGVYKMCKLFEHYKLYPKQEFKKKFCHCYFVNFWASSYKCWPNCGVWFVCLFFILLKLDCILFIV